MCNATGHWGTSCSTCLCGMDPIIKTLTSNCGIVSGHQDERQERLFFSEVNATIQEMGAYLLLPKTTKVHAALPTNSMACTVIHKTYINIVLDPITAIGFAAQYVSNWFTCILSIQPSRFKQSALSNPKINFTNSAHCHIGPLVTSPLTVVCVLWGYWIEKNKQNTFKLDKCLTKAMLRIKTQNLLLFQEIHRLSFGNQHKIWHLFELPLCTHCPSTSSEKILCIKSTYRTSIYCIHRSEVSTALWKHVGLHGWRYAPD